MHFLIDLQGAQNGSRHRGIGRYTLSFAQAFCRLVLGEHRVSLLLNGSFDNCESLRSRFSGLVGADDVHIWYPFGDPSYRWIGNNVRRKASEYLREAVVHEISPDVLIVSSMIEGCDDASVTTIKKFYSATPTVAVFYDAIPHIYSSQYLADPRAKQWYMEKVGFLKNADLLLAISESSKEESIKYLGMPRSSVLNISTALSDDFKEKGANHRYDRTEVSKLGIKDKYILYSGASDVRKNLFRLIDAYRKLPEALTSEYQLVIAGGMPEQHELELKAHAANIGSDNDVIFTQWVSDETLMALYSNASLFVFPSYHEGFGLPILEAMYFGIPVIGSDVSSVPEVIGLNEAMFDPMSVESIADTMARALQDRKFRRRLVNNSRERSQTFSWERTASIALGEMVHRFSGRRPEPKNISLSHHAEMIFDLLETDAPLIPTSDIANTIDKSLPLRSQKPTLFVDVSELHARDSKTGIQRVVINVLSHLQAVVGGVYTVVPVYTDLERDYRVSHKVGLKYIGDFEMTEGVMPDFKSEDIFVGLDFHDVLIPVRRTCFDQMREVGVKVYFVVYDMLPLKLRQYFDEEVSRNFNSWLNTVAQFDGIIAISEAVATDVKKWAERTRLPRQRPLRLGWFHLGADFGSDLGDGAKAEVEAMLKAAAQQQVFISVGTLEPRKRQNEIVEAFETLWESGSDAVLVLVGKRGWLYDEFLDHLDAHVEKGSRLFWFEDASDAALIELFKGATALIAASEDEGFGLPLVEAISMGLPVIARDIPVFREILGEDAHYFVTNEANALAKSIQGWMKAYEAGRCATPSRNRALTWRESAKRFADIVINDNWRLTYVPDHPANFS